MTQHPRTSVVIPAYQNAAFIERTMRSVLNQSSPADEVVVADHSSTDGTWEALQRFSDHPRVTLLRTPAGGGAALNWNRVTDAASGDYLKLVCGDDVLAPTCLEEQTAVLEAHPGVSLVACQRDIVDVQDRVLLKGRGLGGMSGVVPGAQAVRKTVRAGRNLFGEPVCVLMRREAVVAAGPWSAEQPYVIDVDMYSRVLEHGDLYAVARPLACFRVSEDQWSVHLAHAQAVQAAQYHRKLRAQRPHAISRADVRIGNARASLAAVQRRAAYALWSRRMSTAAVTP